MKKKKYISEKIGGEYTRWSNGKVLLFAPTGRGKTTFIMEEAVPFWLDGRKKVKILVNRRSLLRQYIYEEALAQEYYTQGIEMQTYQEFAREIRKNGIAEAFWGYDVVVLDEVHFFISDADFNPYDTYIVWQAILHSYVNCMIFMTATPEELQPFLEEYEEALEKFVRQNRIERRHYDHFWHYELEADYDYVKPEIVPDLETLTTIIAKSQKKSIIFMDNIEKGREMKDQIKSINSNKRIVCLDSGSMDSLNQEERHVMQSLYMANKVECDVLITTSVLDNGVSIHDADVENIAIFTISKSSFLQMLGRIRTEDTDQLNLLLVPQSPKYWERREKMLEEEVEEIDRLVSGGRYEYGCELLCDAVLNDSKMVDLYKKIFLLVPYGEAFPIYNGKNIPVISGGYGSGGRLVINRLSVAKIRQMLHIVRRMHVLSRREIENPCYEQLSWIGKSSDDVICRTSTHLEKEKQGLIERFLEVQNYDKSEFAEWKKKIAKDYRNSCLKHLNLKSGSPIKENDLVRILKEEGFALETVPDGSRRNRYTIKKL